MSFNLGDAYNLMIVCGFDQGILELEKREDVYFYNDRKEVPKDITNAIGHRSK